MNTTRTNFFLDALLGRNESRPPIWLMRQAGRYLPDYQALRKRYSLRELFFTPELAAQITRMPVEQLGVDAAILFSDITVIALALGLKLDFCEGPVVDPLLKSGDDVDRLVLQNVRDVLAPIGETAALAAQSDVPLIGFCGAPFTVACYLTQNHQLWRQSDPAGFHRLLDKICIASCEYLRMQVEKGCSAIQIFDSWADRLTDEEFNVFCLPYWEKLLRSVDVPGIVFARGNSLRVRAIEAIRPAAISVDGQAPLSELRKLTNLTLQGNLDPDLLLAPLPEIRRAAEALLASMKGDRAFIVNLGHGIKPGTPLEAVRCLVELCSQT